MMTPITRRDVIAHQSVVPWPSQFQVEQDLLLCRAMVALFDDSFLQSQIAMRGGTLLHKVHLAPPSRYSEDIDLVVVGETPGGPHSQGAQSCFEGRAGNSEAVRVGQSQAGDSQHRETFTGAADDLRNSFPYGTGNEPGNRG
jgi:uracil-DNA glycosylase